MASSKIVVLTAGVLIPKMSSPNTHSLRIVVQYVRAHQRSVYRLVAYGGEGGSYTSGSIEFESLDRLLQALRSVAPNFDEACLSLQKDGPGSHIVFTGDMELDDSQLSLLGLKDGSRS